MLEEKHFDADNVHRYSIVNEYDGRDRLISTLDPIGNQTLFSYDKNNNLVQVEGPSPEMCKTITYDKANRPIAISEKQSDGSLLTIKNQYDKCGRVISVKDECGTTTTFTYDKLGRVIKTTFADGTFEAKEYDILNNVILEVDAAGYRTEKKYNFRNQVIAVTHPDGTQESFNYNANGTLESAIDKCGIKTAYKYDVFGHIVETKIYSQSGALLKQSSATYSSCCKLFETDFEGVTTDYLYDFAGRKIW